MNQSPHFEGFTPLDASQVYLTANRALHTAGLGYLTEIWEVNTAHDAPYHNAYHSQCVVTQCAEACDYYGITAANKRAVLAAAFFHDFDHSAGCKDDDWNTQLASKRSRELLHKWFSAGLISAYKISTVERSILSTRYPFGADPRSIGARVLRDADMMQCLEFDTDRAVLQYLGLKQEIERQRHVRYSNAEWADGMSMWWKDNTRWLTQWGSERALHFDCRQRYENICNLIRDAVDAQGAVSAIHTPVSR